ncbi:hypothetical protein ACO2JO_19000 [Leptospira interrogans]
MNRNRRSDRVSRQDTVHLFKNSSMTSHTRIRLPQKCLAASSVRRTAPEVMPTATILIRFWVAIDLIDPARADGGPVFDFLRLAFCDVALAAIASSKKMAGQARVRDLTLTLSLSRFCPPICQANMA